MSSYAFLANFRVLTCGVYAVGFAPDNSCFISIGSESGDKFAESLRFWDGHTMEALGEPFNCKPKSPHTDAFSNDSTQLAVGVAAFEVEGKVLLVDVRSKSITRVLRGH